jgi:hypothetical protein
MQKKSPGRRAHGGPPARFEDCQIAAADPVIGAARSETRGYRMMRGQELDMEFDHSFDADLDLSEELPGSEPPTFDLPPVPIPERRPNPAEDARWSGMLMLAVVAGLGGIKLALFAMGTAAAMTGLGVVFVLAHAAVLAGGSAWFWEHRYR